MYISVLVSRLVLVEGFISEWEFMDLIDYLECKFWYL